MNYRSKGLRYCWSNFCWQPHFPFETTTIRASQHRCTFALERCFHSKAWSETRQQILESHWLGELPPKFLPSQNFDQHPMPGVQKKWTSENKLPQIPWLIINFHTSWYINTWTWLYIRGHTICINSTYQIKPEMFSLPPLSPKETRTNLGAAATRQRSIPWRRKATRFNGHLGCPRLEPALDPPVKIAFP